MHRQHPEREQVLKPCLKLCKRLKSQGYILKYRRLDALDMWHENGDPDIEIWVSSQDIVIIIMCECKKPEGGVLSKKQLECRDKYIKFRNVIYIETNSVDILKDLIMKVADNQYFNPEQFNEFKKLSL
jgi:hypothetical protein